MTDSVFQLLIIEAIIALSNRSGHRLYYVIWSENNYKFVIPFEEPLWTTLLFNRSHLTKFIDFRKAIK